MKTNTKNIESNKKEKNKNIRTVAVISSLYAILVTVSDIHSFPLIFVMFSSDFKSNSNPEFVICAKIKPYYLKIKGQSIFLCKSLM